MQQHPLSTERDVLTAQAQVCQSFTQKIWLITHCSLKGSGGPRREKVRGGGGGCRVGEDGPWKNESVISTFGAKPITLTLLVPLEQNLNTRGGVILQGWPIPTMNWNLNKSLFSLVSFLYADLETFQADIPPFTATFSRFHLVFDTETDGYNLVKGPRVCPHHLI